MKAARKAVLGAVVALLALVAWWAYADYDKRAQHRAIAGVVAEASVVIRESLADSPSAERVVAIESLLERLQDTRKKRQLDFASSAEHYLVGARAIAQRRVDVVRLTQHAEAARNALSAHMAGASERGPGWIRQATNLKRRMTQAYNDLQRTQQATAEILYSMPAVTKALSQHVDRSTLVADQEFDAAYKRAEQDAAAAAAAAAR